jgi:hypothetical protein
MMDLLPRSIPIGPQSIGGKKDTTLIFKEIEVYHRNKVVWRETMQESQPVTKSAKHRKESCAQCSIDRAGRGLALQ